MFVERTVLYTEGVSESTPPLPPPPRLPRRRPGPTRRTALTVDGIVAAALEVLDETGVTGLSMRAVAERLGTGAASLYAHVSGREELLELMFDELVGRVALPEPDAATWREQLRAMLTDFYGILRSHRDVALAGLGRVPTTPRSLVAAETTLAIMRAGGLTDRVAGLGIDQLLLYVAASAFESGIMEERGMSEAEITEYYDSIDAFYARLPADRFPGIVSIATSLTEPGELERFTFGLEVLIAGLEAMSAAERGA